MASLAASSDKIFELGVDRSPQKIVCQLLRVTMAKNKRKRMELAAGTADLRGFFGSAPPEDIDSMDGEPGSQSQPYELCARGAGGVDG